MVTNDRRLFGMRTNDLLVAIETDDQRTTVFCAITFQLKWPSKQKSGVCSTRRRSKPIFAPLLETKVTPEESAMYVAGIVLSVNPASVLY